MKVLKSYILDKEQQDEIDAIIKKGREEYACIAHIVWETEEDMSIFFSDDLED